MQHRCRHVSAVFRSNSGSAWRSRPDWIPMKELAHSFAAVLKAQPEPRSKNGWTLAPTSRPCPGTRFNNVPLRKAKLPTLISALCVAVATIRPVAAQSITVLLLDGRTMKPIEHSWLNLWSNLRGAALPLAFDSEGRANVLLITGKQDESLAPASSGIPTLPYTDTLHIQLGFQPCWEKTAKTPQFERFSFSTKNILDGGLAEPNNCGSQKVAVHPGELVLYVKPLSFWQRMRD